MSKGVRVHATVRIEIELVESAWGGDCPLEQVYKQARDGALGRIGRLSRGEIAGPSDIRIIGEPIVTAVLVPEKP